MTKSKFRTITIAALSFLLALLLSLAAGMIMPRVSVSAEEYSPSNIFSAGSDTKVTGTEEGETSYLAFEHTGTGATAYYRRDLALKWFASKEGASYLSLTLAFPEAAFSEYTVSFESAEENITEDEIAKNSILLQTAKRARLPSSPTPRARRARRSKSIFRATSCSRWTKRTAASASSPSM